MLVTSRANKISFFARNCDNEIESGGVKQVGGSRGLKRTVCYG